MRKIFAFLLVFTSFLLHSQTDYSNSWEDFYSYNNVKDFIKVDNIVYALTDNAIFTYNESTLEVNKISSVQGLSGETTSSIYFNNTFQRIVIGYENGLVEVIDLDGSITISADIINFNQTGEKAINHISENGNILYLSTPFGIVEYNIERLEFGDTFFIGNNSTSLTVNETLVITNVIYAVTEDGIFTADANSDLLIDFNNWQQFFPNRNFTNIVEFNNRIYVSENTSVFEFDGSNLNLSRTFNQNINDLKATSQNYTVALNTSAHVLDSNQNTIIEFLVSPDFEFTLSTAFFENNRVYLGTQEFGILSATANNSNTYEEIHPQGPLANDVFSIAASNENLWVVYGGYDGTYTPLARRRGYDHFNGEQWINTRFDENNPYRDLSHVSIDPNAENKVYISSFADTRNINTVETGGLLVVENDEVTQFYNHLNSGLEDLEPTIPDRVTLRISGSAFDRDGNLWVTNIHRERELKKLSPSGQWSQYDISSLKTSPDLFGLSEVAIDRSNSVWIGTRRNGVYVFNEQGNRQRALFTTPNDGNLPDTDVLAVAVDRNNRVWLGTRAGMVVYTNAAGVFDADVVNAQPVIIEENGVGERLLGDQRVNSIVVDGANNKWFGTDNGGVLYTSPSGRRTLANFSKENSPLPSNRIFKIAVDESSGKVYFATDKGIVAYNSDVAPFGETLGEVYAYPNPALKNHDTVTIDGRNGTNLPRGTNVKILDVAGNLVFETNVLEGQELQGGKVTWNKRNLAGNKVASGIYIVLLSNEDASETSTTKIAIVN